MMSLNIFNFRTRKTDSAMRRFFIFGIISSLIVSLISPAYRVLAVSAYDNHIKVTDRLYVSSSLCTDPSSTKDVTDNHLAVLDEAYSNTVKRFQPWDNNRRDRFISKFNEYKAIFDASVDGLGYYSIDQLDNGSSKHFRYIAILKDDYSSNLFTNTKLELRSKGGSYFAYIDVGYHSNCDLSVGLGGLNSSDGSYFRHSMVDYSPSIRSFFVSTFPIVYPEGYEGIRLENHNLTSRTDLTPSVFYQLKDRHLTVNLCVSGFENLCKVSPLPWGKDTKIKYSIKSNPSDIEPLHSSTLSNPDFLQFKYDFPSRGKYYLIVEYVWPGVPYPGLDDKYNFHVLNLPINVDGSTYFSGSYKQDCDDGACEEHSPYNDCSIKGATVLDNFVGFFDSLVCHIQNLGIFIGKTIEYLFIPDSSVVSRQFNDLVENLKSSLGFLWTPVDFVVRTVQLLSGNLPNPVGNNCNIGTFPLFGSGSRSIELCAWRHQLPALWDIIRLFFQGAIAVLIISMFYRRLSDIFGFGSSTDADSLTLGRRD